MAPGGSDVADWSGVAVESSDDDVAVESSDDDVAVDSDDDEVVAEPEVVAVDVLVVATVASGVGATVSTVADLDAPHPTIASANKLTAPERARRTIRETRRRAVIGAPSSIVGATSTRGTRHERAG